jgi:STE24 endopeptidase
MFEIFSLYTIIAIVVSLLQIKYIKKKRVQEPFLLPKDEFIEAGIYKEKREFLAIFERIFEFIIFIFWFTFGLYLLDINLNSIENIIYKNIIFINIFLLINMIFSFPMDYYIKFKLDKEFGFSTISLQTYLFDTIKSILLTLFVTTIVVGAISYIIENFNNWWIYGFSTIFALIVLINLIYPTIIAPMFNKFTPLENEKLKLQIENLLNRVNFKSNGVFVVDASKRDNRLNAYFGGFGKSKRVVLFDTLIQKLSTNELLAVLGHELGHFKHMDIFKNIVMMGIILGVVFYYFGTLELSSTFIIALFLLTISSFTFFLLPIINFVSRHNEFEADKFGSDLVNKDSLKSALIKLVNENKAFPYSHKIYIFFYYSHPPLEQRLEKLS